MPPSNSSSSLSSSNPPCQDRFALAFDHALAVRYDAFLLHFLLISIPIISNRMVPPHEIPINM